MEAILYKKISIPQEFLSFMDVGGKKQAYGGDIRIGDLDGDGNVDFVVYKSLGGMKPCFIGAFNMDGEALWSYGDKDLEMPGEVGILTAQSPDRPGPVAVYDIDMDGKAEVICLAIAQNATTTTKWAVGQTEMLILNGETGEVKAKAAPPRLQASSGYVEGELMAPNYVHQRLLIANFRSREKSPAGGEVTSQDFVVKLGKDIFAFNDKLEILWHYVSKWNQYPAHAAYIPAVGDIDGDGCDEVNGGHFLLDQNGEPLWEKFMGNHNDSVLVEDWGEYGKKAILSGYGQVVDCEGNVLLKLGKEVVPHGQEIRYGDVRSDCRGAELIIRYRGHTPDLMVVSQQGEILDKFRVDDSPNNTGLEIVHWGEKAFIYSPAALYDGYGKKVSFPHLPAPTGGKMGWYHCFPANVCGDEREEVILFDPYSDTIYIYTQEPFNQAAFKGYQHTARQYNARLMD